MNVFLRIKKKLLLSKYSDREPFKRFYSEVSLLTPIQEVSFVVFDTETTGLDPKKDEVVSIGALKVEALEVNLSSAFHKFMNPSNLKGSSVEVHGITHEELSGKAQDEREVVEAFLEYVKGSVLVGFNVEFDKKMVEKYTLRHFGIPLLNYRLDVFHLWKRTSGRGGSLKDIADELDIPVTNVHSALEDSYITALVFLKLVYRMRRDPLGTLPLMI